MNVVLLALWVALPAQFSVQFGAASQPVDEDAAVLPMTSSTQGPVTGRQQLLIQPFLWVTGGIKYDHPFPIVGQKPDDRGSTYMLADFGVRGSFDTWLSFESEFMANGGVGLRGTSVFEGQASLQVRKQTIHLQKGIWTAEVGRVVDEASVDFFSEHVTQTFMQDSATRDALLYSGFNLGNGVRGTVQVAEGLRLGLALNAGNPVSNSATLSFGGNSPPYSRVYLQPFQTVGPSANKYPDDTYQSYVLSPSLLYTSKYVDFRVALQGQMIDTNTATSDNDTLFGMNARGTLRLNLLDGMLCPFGNYSIDFNQTLNSTDLSVRNDALYVGQVFGGGLDFNYSKTAGRGNGVGIQYEEVLYRQDPKAGAVHLRFANVGTTYWLNQYLSVGGRVSFWGQSDNSVKLLGELSVLLNMRLVM